MVDFDRATGRRPRELPDGMAFYSSNTISLAHNGMTELIPTSSGLVVEGENGPNDGSESAG